MLCLETVESRFEIIEVWNVGREAGSHTLQQETWGYWTPAAGLRQVARENKYDRRKDLQGFHLRVATIKVIFCCSLQHSLVSHDFFLLLFFYCSPYVASIYAFNWEVNGIGKLAYGAFTLG